MRETLSFSDRVFRGVTLGAAAVGAFVLAAILAVLALASRETLADDGIAFLLRADWNPVVGPGERYGVLALAWGTVVTSILALSMAVPVSLGVTVFLSEMAPRRVASVVGTLVELLSAVPSVVFGLFGLLALRPVMAHTVEPFLARLSNGAAPFSGPATGSDILVASIVLAFMIVPTISALSREVLSSVPVSLREAALSLGATRSEALVRVVLPRAKRGIVGAVLLGLGRALGETMAVTMLIGNQPDIRASLFAQGASMASMIANQYPEASGKQMSALNEVGLLLFLLTVALNVMARLLVRPNRLEQGV